MDSKNVQIKTQVFPPFRIFYKIDEKQFVFVFLNFLNQDVLLKIQLKYCSLFVCLFVHKDGTEIHMVGPESIKKEGNVLFNNVLLGVGVGGGGHWWRNRSLTNALFLCWEVIKN